jgi:tRNA threonylcarbamoyladenosine biosynthesis protein TsaE
MRIITNSASETKALGEKLARLLKGKEILCLFGQLGSGKTTLVKGLASGLGVKQTEVNSPTFILMRKYAGRLPLYHFDLYRVKNKQEICGIGYEEFIYNSGVAVIEWADKMGSLLPKDYLRIDLSFLEPEKRLLKFSADHKYYRELIRKLCSSSLK